MVKRCNTHLKRMQHEFIFEQNYNFPINKIKEKVPASQLSGLFLLT